MNDNLIEDYRNTVTNALLDNDLICSILGDGEIPDDRDTLVWTHIFPNQYIPDTVQDAGSYIFYDIDEALLKKVTTYTELELYFWIFTHKDTPTYNGSLRNDILSRELKYMFEGHDNNQMGIAPNRFISNKVYMPYNFSFGGRVLMFKITDFSTKPRVRK